jgi:protoporphyrinogen oxidase
MNFKEKQIVILGGGSAGLSAAVQLIDGGKSNVVVIEKEADVGGLALSFEYGDYKVDYGPHAFHCKGDETDALFKKFCPNGYKDVYMKACLFLDRKYFEYPLKFGQAILRINPSISAKMIMDYFSAAIKRTFRDMPEDSFEAWGVKRYGRTIYELAFGNYSQKVWGTPTTELHWKMAQQKLPNLNFWELVKETLGGKGAKQKILYSSYLYPNGGIGTVFESMENYIIKNGGNVLKDAKPTQINLDEGGNVDSVFVKKNGDTVKIPCSYLVPTIPIPSTVNLIKPAPSDKILQFARNLIYRNLILVMLEIDMENVTNQIMVYLLDKDFTFNRIGEQKNIEPSMIPQNKTILCFEICADEKSELWNKTNDELFELAKADLAKLNKVPENKISGYFIKRLQHAYPVYDLTFDVNLNGALDYLLDIHNVIPLGRQGLFIHNDIHDSMKMGIDGAKFILSDNHKSEWKKQVRKLLNWRLE